MESQKDNQVAETSKGQNAPQGFSRFLSLKLERLTAATYMVTDFLSDNEPIKWKLREKSLSIITDQSLSLRSGSGSYRLADYGQLSRAIEGLITVLDIALIGNAVSVMNFSILKNEYQNLIDLIGNRAVDLSVNDYVNSREIAEAEKAITTTNPTSLANPVFTDRPTFQKNLSPLVGRAVAQTNIPKYFKDSTYSKGQVSSIKDNSFSVKDNLNKETKVNAKKGTRRETILNFLKDKEWVGIMDIARSISGCSVKTVQRELADLVKDGLLKKQGEKRWSRYVLVA